MVKTPDMLGDYTSKNKPTIFTSGEDLAKIETGIMEYVFLPENSWHLHYNPIQKSSLNINNTYCFEECPTAHFELINPMKHHTTTPIMPGINSYSFALEPEKTQASGGFNFSMVRDPKLTLYFSKASTSTSRTCIPKRKISVYALNYNTLTIAKNKVILAFN